MTNFKSQFSKIDLPLIGLVKLPNVKITDKERQSVNLSSNAPNSDFLKKLAWKGFLEKEGVDGTTREQAIERLKVEFDVFEKTGTIDYILLIYDIVRWCDENNIARGPGRGSCAASFAFYCLEITKPNPIRFNLTFTRFISEARVKPQIVDGIIYADGNLLMDVDLDISYNDRTNVIRYIEEAYPGSVCKISNRIGLSPKVALKDVLKIYSGYEEPKAKNISDNIEIVFGKSQSLSKALAESKKLQKWAESDENKLAYTIAQKLEGLNNAKGQHASGIFVSADELDGNIPIERSKTKEIVTGYDMEIAAQVGVKVDILGLRTLDVIRITCDAVGINENDINVNDPTIYQYFSTKNLFYGLFQIEDGLTKQVISKVMPRNIDQLSVCLAISRPGALKYVDDFAAYVNHGTLKPIHPKFDAILEETGNILVYQEQVNRVLQEIYGFSAIEAEDTRRVIGKKKKKEMASLEPVLYEEGEKRGVPKETTKYFWDVCNASADYLFNAAHSVSYAYITAYTTYLKDKYPQQFMMALLKMAQYETKPLDALAKITAESQKMGIKILPPDLMKSKRDFSIDGDNNIRFGLSYIKGVSGTTIDSIVDFRRNFSNKFEIFQAAKDAKLRINVLAGLIYCGCINVRDTDRSRAYLAFECQLFNCLTDKEKRLVLKLGEKFDYDLAKIINYLKDHNDENGKPYIKDTRIETLKKKYMPFWEIYKSNSKNKDLCEYIMEKFFLGVSYSHTIEGIFSESVMGLKTIEEIQEFPEKTSHKFVGFVEDPKMQISKNNKAYLKMSVLDETGMEIVMLFGDDKIDNCKKQNGNKLPEDGDLVIIDGTKADGAAFFADSVYVQSMPIKISKRDLQK